MEPDVDKELNEALGRLQDAVDELVTAIKREWTDFLNRWAEGVERKNAERRRDVDNG